MNEKLVPQCVQVHLSSFRNFFLSILGSRFLTVLYRSFALDPDCVSLVAVDDSGVVVGVIAGPKHPAGFYSRLLRKRWWQFGCASVLPLIHNPAILPRLCRAVFYRGEPPPGPSRALLTSVAVDPKSQGMGVGRKLVKAWLDEVERSGVDGAYLTTDADKNEGTNHFYVRLGWKVEETFSTPEGRRMNRYIIDFPKSIDSRNGGDETLSHFTSGALRKRLFDATFAAFGLIAIAPVLALIAAALLGTSGRPILFRQKRVGLRGRLFTLYKFRTMTLRSETEAQPNFEPGSSVRVTRIGKWLRKSKLDELPQLWNVVKGDMSIVGPRPEVPEWVAVYPHRWRKVHLVRPGITDPASVCFHSEEQILALAPDPDRMYREEILPKKLGLYEDYIRAQSIVTDIKIILATFRIIGAKAVS